MRLVTGFDPPLRSHAAYLDWVRRGLHGYTDFRHMQGCLNELESDLEIGRLNRRAKGRSPGRAQFRAGSTGRAVGGGGVKVG